MNTQTLLALLVTAGLVGASAACSSPAATTTQQSGGGGAQDGGGDAGATDSQTAGTDTIQTGADGTVQADAEEDTDVAADTSVDTAGLDVLLGDTAKLDATTDATIDATKSDTTAQDIKADAKADAAPAKCGSDADCPKGYGDCLPTKCDVASGLCKMVPAADGTACKLGGLCGGVGTCSQGACNAGALCDPVACQPKPLACGAKIVIEPTKLPPGIAQVWPCTGSAWGGGEQFYSLSSEVTVVASVALAADALEAAALILLGPVQAGTCAPKSCKLTGPTLTIGLPAGVAQIIAVDTKAGSSAALTLTVTCGEKPKCGDGICALGEACSSCPGDCGLCTACGDKTCDATKENCGSCPDDCGACPPVPTECVSKSSMGLPGDPSPTGCGGCGCEACVCKQDPFCCQTAWDGACVSQCTSDCGGPKCPTLPTWCGDKKCNASETSKTCPQDCGEANSCGDGSCAGSESCSTCPVDCGGCSGGTPPGPVCGDGKCDTAEHCGSCPKDCGVCTSDCPNLGKTSNAPGCGGCACEAQVCKEDPYCCDTAWDSLCVSECVQALSAVCPKDLCGDGICSGSENCDSCNSDCGACVCGDGVCSSSENDTKCPADCIKCGDGKCSAGETLESCKVDCGYGCEGKCGSSSKDAQGGSCWCDDYCTQAGDCCDDKATYCP